MEIVSKKRKRPYVPELHDPELIRLNAEGHDDLTISIRMAFNAERITRERNRLGLPRHHRQVQAFVKQKEPPPPRDKPNPVALAMAWLGPRVVEKHGCYFLDGCPARIDQIIREANLLLKQADQPQIRGSDRWSV